jgi:hypothetical protein
VNDEDLSGYTGAELERRADGLVTAADNVTLEMVPLLVELYRRRIWQDYGLTITEYFRDRRGLGKIVKLSEKARKELVLSLSAAVPDAPVQHFVLLSGGWALRTIQSDRAELGVANQTRSEAQKEAKAAAKKADEKTETLAPEAFAQSEETGVWLAELPWEELYDLKLQVDAEVNKRMKELRV